MQILVDFHFGTHGIGIGIALHIIILDNYSFPS